MELRYSIISEGDDDYLAFVKITGAESVREASDLLDGLDEDACNEVRATNFALLSQNAALKRTNEELRQKHTEQAQRIDDLEGRNGTQAETIELLQKENRAMRLEVAQTRNQIDRVIKVARGEE